MSAKRPTRRQFLRGAAAVGSVMAVDGFAIEPRWLDVVVHRVAVERLPASMEGYRIAQVTDVHLTSLGMLHESIARALDSLHPQLVALTGDVVDSAATLPTLTALCRMFTRPGRTLVATAGNWEHWGNVSLDALDEAYRRGGATFLGNESRTLGGLHLATTDDGCTDRADLARALRDLPHEHPRVLLTHAPGVLDTPPEPPPLCDLALAGHTHGGQVRVPFTAVTPPGSGRFVAGFYDTPYGRAYVSRGVGTSILPVRFLNRPELPVFELVRG